MDVHGLHKAEVIICLEELLPKLKSLGLKCAHIITGTGHHTVGSSGHGKGPKLLPVVTDYLSTEYAFNKFVDIKDCNGYVGGICLYF